MINAAAIAAGEYQSIAVTDSGTVSQWGEYSNGTTNYSVTNSSVATLPPSSNVVAVAAGLGQALALLADGSVVAWGLTNVVTNSVPTNAYPATAIAAGWMHNVALLTNGTVFAWGDDTYHQTEVPSNLSNVVAIAAGGNHSLAVMANGTVVPWGNTNNGLTNIPPEVTNVVAVAAGAYHSLALKVDGTVVAWGNNDFGQTNVPTGMSNFMAIAAGDGHSLALINDGTVVSWGTNSYGQTNHFPQGPGVGVKLIAAGGNHSMAALFSSSVQYYPIDISKDLLLIYNTNSTDSWNVCQYYRTNRPMVSNANVLGIGCTTNTVISPNDFANIFQTQVQNWLSTNRTKRPLYVVLFQNLPQEVNSYTNAETAGDGHLSVQVQLHSSTSTGWYPFVTSINMNGNSGTNAFSSDGTIDCIAYIDKVVSFASNGQLFISASAGRYSNTNWYFDSLPSAVEGVTNVDPTASIYGSTLPAYTSLATNVAGYYTCGWDCGLGTGSNRTVSFATNGQVAFSGNSGWYIMTTLDSYNGQRVTGQAGYLTWFATNAFGGTNYSNTPVGAATTVNEPHGVIPNPEI